MFDKFVNLLTIVDAVKQMLKNKILNTLMSALFLYPRKIT